jgi:hypothetical protein
MTEPKRYALPTGSYWEDHQGIGEFPISPHSRVLVSTVMKEGRWYIRLRTYRLVQRGGKEQWIHTNQLMLFPPESIPALRALLAESVESLPAETLSANGQAAAAGLTADELEAEGATELPDREAMSFFFATVETVITTGEETILGGQ